MPSRIKPSRASSVYRGGTWLCVSKFQDSCHRSFGLSSSREPSPCCQQCCDPSRASSESSGLGVVGEDVAHGVGSAPRRGLVVVCVALEGEGGGYVPGEGLEVPYGLPALGEEREVRVPEIMEANGGEPCLFEEWIEGAVDGIPSV